MTEQQAAGQDTGQTQGASAATAGAAQTQGQQNGAGGQQTAADAKQGTQAETQQQGAAQAKDGQQKPGSIASGSEADDTREAPALFPDDWREQLAGGDAKFLATLKRHASPAAFAKAYRELQTKMATTRPNIKPGDDASEDEKAVWRTQQGIPDKPEEYEKGWKAPEGFILSDGDKELMKGFAASVHAKDWTQQHFNDAMGWYVKHMADQQAARQDMDLDHQAEAMRELRAELGPADFKRGIASIDALRQHEGEEGLLNTILDNARMPDGRKLGDMPGVVKMLMNWANEIDPQARIAPADGSLSGKNIETRIAEIDAIQADPKRANEYWKNPKMQEEYGRLLAARDKLANRRAA